MATIRRKRAGMEQERGSDAGLRTNSDEILTDQHAVVAAAERVQDQARSKARRSCR